VWISCAGVDVGAVVRAFRSEPQHRGRQEKGREHMAPRQIRNRRAHQIHRHASRFHRRPRSAKSLATRKMVGPRFSDCVIGWIRSRAGRCCFFAGKVLSASKRLEGLLRLDARRCWNTARANIGWTFEVSDERRLPRKSMQASRHSKMQNEDQLRLVKYKYPPLRSTSLWSRRRPGAPPNVTGARRC